jgi:hypothetical protein
MKTTMTLLTALLVLQVNILFAGNESVSPLASNAGTSFSLAALAPVTPATATFEEFTTASVNGLAPVMPVEADFSDVVETPAIDLVKLAPVAPAEADFE